MTGCGASTASRVSRLNASRVRCHSRAPMAAVAARSSPDEKAPPSPKQTIARASVDAASASRSPSAWSAPGSKALSRSALDHRIHAAAPSRSSLKPAPPHRRTRGRASSTSPPSAAASPP
jgi:hypothetical protein